MRSNPQCPPEGGRYRDQRRVAPKTLKRRRLPTNRLIQAFRLTILKPIAAIRHPPAQDTQRNGRRDSPPERQSNIRQQTQYSPRGPEDLSLHPSILARLGMRDAALLQNDNTSCARTAFGASNRNRAVRLLAGLLGGGVDDGLLKRIHFRIGAERFRHGRSGRLKIFLSGK